jgi:alpha-tubulin suppressor-like RCC1 family protein/sugar lactone lactonase YvrE
MGLKLRTSVYRQIKGSGKRQRFSSLVFRRVAVLLIALFLGLTSFLSIGHSTEATANEWYEAGWDKLSVGSNKVCGISLGNVYCWGIMTGTNIREFVTPTKIDTGGVWTGKTVTDISTSFDHSCAVADGAAFCWGYGGNGQLGDGTLANSNTPVAVDASGVLNGKVVTAVSTGVNTSCAIADGSVYCWGDNGDGQLGDGTTTTRPAPVAIDSTNILSGKTVTKLSMGAGGGCVIASGAPYCWTSRPGNGTAYMNNVAHTITAVNISGVLSGKTVTAITAGSSSCAIADELPYCWGYDSYGELGAGGPGTTDVPIAVDASGVLNGKTVTSLPDSDNDGDCVLAAGKAFCWGANYNGQLGDGTLTDRNVPTAVDDTGALSGKVVTAVSNSQMMGCAIANRIAYCWANDAYIGDGVTTHSLTPAEVKPPTPTISSLSHTKGRLSGGNTILIGGTNFDPTDAAVFVGGISAEVTYRYSNATLGITVPSSATSGTVDVKVVNPDGREATLQNAYTYTTDPIIDLTNQTTGLINSTINSSIQGDNFDAAATVTVGGIPAQILYQDSTSLLFTVPSSTTTKTVDIVVTNPNGASAISSSQFSYVTSNPPHIQATDNGQVQINNGTTLAYVYGSNFDNQSTVTVRGVQAQISYRAAGGIIYYAPSSPDLGPADVTVTNSIGESETYTNGITYIPKRAPSIVSISTDKAPINSSSTQAYIYGNDFDMNSTVTVGGVAAQIGDQSTSHIHIAIPSSSVLGKVDVIVTNADGQSTTLQDGIEYVSQLTPSISSLYPNPATGLTLGGDFLYIYGSDFTDPVVTIGGAVAAIQSNDSSYIRVTVPPASTAGAVDIKVTNSGGQTVTASDQYVYVKPRLLSNQFKGSIGENGAGNGQFNWPENITIDNDGLIYVTDNGNNRVEVFNPDGTYVRQFGTSGLSAGQIDYATAIKIGPDENVYVLDSGTLKVSVFTKSGTYLRRIDVSNAGYPEGMAFNSKGDMYLTDCDAESTLKVYKTDGTYLRSIGTDGSGDGQFDCSYAVTVDANDNVYVADAGNDRIQVFDKNDNFIRKFGSRGIGEGQLGWVEDLTIDKFGNILVVDSDNNRIQVFNKTGTYLGQIGRIGSGDGQFDYPNSIAINQAGDLYITDASNDRIQEFEGMTQVKPPVTTPVSTPVSAQPVTTPKNKEVVEVPVATENTTKEPVITLNGDTLLEENAIISKRPTFSGVAAPFAEVVITIHSDPVVCKTTADAEGKWSCTLDRDLPSGNHHVTIELTNQDGTKTTLGPYAVQVKGGDTVNSDKSLTPAKNSSKDTSKRSPDWSPLYLVLAGVVIASILVIGTTVLKRRKANGI